LPGELAEAVANALPRLGVFGRRIAYFSTIGSTNDVAARLAASVGAAGIAGVPGVPGIDDAEGAVVVADAQTAGRGRRGRTWFSPPGAGLYVSTVLAPARARDPGRARTLTTLAAGVALAEGIEKATGLRTELKWPNDLFVAHRKLAGILAEAVGDGVVLGYGINVSPAAYPPELAGTTTSLESELGRTIDRAQVFAETLAGLAARYDDLLASRFDAILDAWRARASRAEGARVSWTTLAGVQTGITAGIDDRGALLIRIGNRTERIVAGELSWV
jgi:BirA family biotin operon repressor/biotin-[acetyl-CoA-carboxylase] ligase